MSILTLEAIDALAVIFKIIQAELLLEIREIACNFESRSVVFLDLRYLSFKL